MADIVYVGASPNDGTGDTLRAAFAQVNARFQAIAGTFTGRGAWVTGTAYNASNRDWVMQAGEGYVCVVSHTSGTFATDLSAGKWVAVDLLTYIADTQPTIDSAKPMQSYTALRAYSGSAAALRLTAQGIAGHFRRDDADTTSPDNGGTVIVDASSRRWKRLFDGVIMANWFVASSDAGDITLALRRACVAAEGVARVVLAPGQYTAATTLQIGDLDSVYLDATGAKVTAVADVSILRAGPMAPTVDEPTLPILWQAVQSVLPISGSAAWDVRKAIEVTDGSAYATNDLVKIVADDKQRCTRSANETIRLIIASGATAAGDLSITVDGELLAVALTTDDNVNTEVVGKIVAAWPAESDWTAYAYSNNVYFVKKTVGNSTSAPAVTSGGTGVVSSIYVSTEYTGKEFLRGWMGVVESVSGNIVTIDRPVPWDMTTNPRIGRMPRRRYDIRGGVFGYETGHDLTWRAVPFMFYGVSDLRLDNVDFEHTYNAAITTVGCFEPIIKVSGRDLRNDQNNNQFGYLLNDNSYFSRVDIVAGRNRHGYTTNQPMVFAESNQLELYGATYGALVTGQSNGNSQAGFDTHHGSECITFQGCVSQGNTQGGGSFVLRGLGHKLINPVAQNGKVGVYAYTEPGVTDMITSAEIVNPEIDVDAQALILDSESNITVVGGTLQSRQYGQVVKAVGNLVLRGSIRITPGGVSLVDSQGTVYLTDCEVDARQADILFDLSNVPATYVSGVLVERNYSLVRQGSASVGATTWAGGTLRSINDTAMTTVFTKEGTPAGTVSFAPNTLITQKEGSNPSVGCDITGSGGVGFSGPWQWMTENHGKSSAYIRYDLSAGGYLLPLRNRGDKLIVVRLKVPTSTTYTLGALPTTPVIGQMLLLHNHHLSLGNITVAHGTSYLTSLPGNSNITLSPGSSLSLIFDGTYWVKGV